MRRSDSDVCKKYRLVIAYRADRLNCASFTELDDCISICISDASLLLIAVAISNDLGFQFKIKQESTVLTFNDVTFHRKCIKANSTFGNATCNKSQSYDSKFKKVEKLNNERL